MRRGLRRRGSSSVASTALSFLDIVSAGFGGAVFLFIVFASLPIDTRAPAKGGGGRFIDILVEWPRLSAREQESTTPNSEGDAEGTVMGWFPDVRWDQVVDKDRWQRVLERFSDCDSLKAGGIIYWVEPIFVVDGEILDPNNKLDTPVEALVSDDGCFEFTAYLETEGSRTDAGLGRMALGSINRVREPLVDLHIVYEPLRGNPYQTRLSALAGGLDPGTDTAAQREEMPWDSIHVTGFDPFGRYTSLGESHEPHTMHVRVLEPRGGKWRFKAKVYSAGSVPGEDAARDTASIEAAVTILCSQEGGGVDGTTTVELLRHGV